MVSWETWVSQPQYAADSKHVRGGATQEIAEMLNFIAIHLLRIDVTK